MPRTILTDAVIRQAKPQDRPVKLSDSHGLHLLITPGGSKLWRLAYRWQGKQRTLALGIYPTVSLKEARRKQVDAKDKLMAGTDPGIAQRIRRMLKHGDGNRFRDVADELMAKLEAEGLSSRTIGKNRWLLAYALPFLGDRPIGEIKAPELLLVLRTVETLGKYQTTIRLRGLCGMIFRYAIATGRAERDPTADLRGALITPKTKHRPAIVDAAGAGALLRAIDGYDGRQPTTRIALQLLALTFVRSEDLRHAEWPEIDLNSSEWRIPAARMKMNRPHRVPLSRQAIALLKQLQPMTGHSRYLFPATFDPSRPMTENALNGALRRLGYDKDQMCAHGFRSLASTRLNEMGKFSADAIERQLAHVEGNASRRAYMAAAEFWNERVEMMQVWADHLDTLRDGGKVIPMKGAA